MKLIEVVAEEGHTDTVLGIAEQQGAVDCWVGASQEEGRVSVRMVTDSESTQPIIDALHTVLAASSQARLVIINVEASLPRPEATETRGRGRRPARGEEERGFPRRALQQHREKRPPGRRIFSSSCFFPRWWPPLASWKTTLPW